MLSATVISGCVDQNVIYNIYIKRKHITPFIYYKGGNLTKRTKKKKIELFFILQNSM